MPSTKKKSPMTISKKKTTSKSVAGAKAKVSLKKAGKKDSVTHMNTDGSNLQLPGTSESASSFQASNQPRPDTNQMIINMLSHLDNKLEWSNKELSMRMDGLEHNSSSNSTPVGSPHLPLEDTVT